MGRLSGADRNVTATGPRCVAAKKIVQSVSEISDEKNAAGPGEARERQEPDHDLAHRLERFDRELRPGEVCIVDLDLLNGFGHTPFPADFRTLAAVERERGRERDEPRLRVA